MSDRSSPIVAPKVDDEELPPVMQSTEQQVDQESSSDDIPLRQRRPTRAPTYDLESSYDLRDRRQPKDHMRKINDTPLLEHRRVAHQATLRESPKTPAKSSGKTPKKPGPRPWASKPIKKNDMKAKKEVIREIEGYWGKGFIRAYIPKCHRPLVKRGKGGKRAMYRDHETDPTKWLPSVLKSILGLATLTQNKAWLKKAMNDVVRYRIKNTGNRKPQLVTTDFDVLEDMLIKDWDVPYSFSIRYKHLLVNRQGQQETDEDIDHILGVGSDREDHSDDEDNDGGNSAEDEADVDDEDGSEEELNQGGLTGQYLHKSGYIDAPQFSPPYPKPGPPFRKQKTKAENSSKRGAELSSRPQAPSHNIEGHQGYSHPYPYGFPIDPWGRPIPYGAGYGNYDGYGIHSAHVGQGRPPSRAPGYDGPGQYYPRHSMTPAISLSETNPVGRKRSRGLSPGGHKLVHNDYERSPFFSGHPGFQPRGYPQSFHDNYPEVKQEPPDVERHGESREASIGEVEIPTDEIGEDSNAAALDAELRATELELKVARLQARRAALSQKSKTK